MPYFDVYLESNHLDFKSFFYYPVSRLETFPGYWLLK